MIRIAICDDSINDANSLRLCCQSCDLSDTAEISVFYSGIELINSHQNKKFDIILLDVDMPVIDGINTGLKIRSYDKQSIIIFTTSYPQYAIDAYDCEAFHYILKPYSQEKISIVLKKAIEKLGIIHKYHKIKIQNKTQHIPIFNIFYIEYCRKHIIYHLQNHTIETTGKFADVIYELRKYGFYQVHQGYIVNLEKIKDIDKFTIILVNLEKVPISVRKKSEVLLAYAKYVEAYQ